jgi:uncharacterized protein YndB with AHSA1/START domain
MNTAFPAKAQVTVRAPRGAVWKALVDPVLVKQYMFGAIVESEWKVGSSITWRGEWEGKPYEDKGMIRRLEPGAVLAFTHASGMSPERVHNVAIELDEVGGRTTVTLVQDGNANAEEQGHSRKNWEAMLKGLKKVVEDGTQAAEVAIRPVRDRLKDRGTAS